MWSYFLNNALYSTALCCNSTSWQQPYIDTTRRMRLQERRRVWIQIASLHVLCFIHTRLNIKDICAFKNLLLQYPHFTLECVVSAMLPVYWAQITGNNSLCMSLVGHYSLGSGDAYIELQKGRLPKGTLKSGMRSGFIDIFLKPVVPYTCSIFIYF